MIAKLKLKKGEMGIGTLILFIAFILVAAVAAAVLVSTTQSLQSKALATGKATQAEIGTSMTAVEVYAEDGSDQGVEYFYETIKLASGSDPIRFQDLLLVFNTPDTSREFTYDSTISCADTTVTSAASIYNDTNSANFGIAYSLQAGTLTGYLTTGDVVKLCYAAPRQINESEDIKLNIIPKVGAPLVVDVTTPQLMTDTRIYIFP